MEIAMAIIRTKSGMSKCELQEHGYKLHIRQNIFILKSPVSLNVHISIQNFHVCREEQATEIDALPKITELIQGVLQRENRLIE